MVNLIYNVEVNSKSVKETKETPKKPCEERPKKNFHVGTL